MKTNTILLLLLFFLSSKTSAQTPGVNLFDDSFVHEIRLTSYYSGFWDTLTLNYLFSFNFNQQQIRDIPYAPAIISVDGMVRDSAGVRHKGFNSWWSSGKKPMKIDLNEYKSGQKLDKEKKFNLHNGAADPTMLRENLSYRILREMGIKAPRTAFAAVYLDDQYIGLYRLVEQVDNTFLDVNYGNHAGNLYEQHSPGSGGFDLSWLGNDPAAYSNNIQKVNNEAANDWTDLLHLLEVLQTNPAALNTVFDVPEFLKVFAFDQASGNLDFYNTTGRNYALYHDISGDGRFHWLPWDYNLTFNRDNPPITIPKP